MLLNKFLLPDTKGLTVWMSKYFNSVFCDNVSVDLKEKNPQIFL